MAWWGDGEGGEVGCWWESARFRGDGGVGDWLWVLFKEGFGAVVCVSS